MLDVLMLVVFTHNRLPTTVIGVGSLYSVGFEEKKHQIEQHLFQMAQQPSRSVPPAATAHNHKNEGGGSPNDGENVTLCTICLEPAVDNGHRTVVQLACRHRFHLDCIGSEFNARGVMRCPNCRGIEAGEWRFPNGPCIHTRTNENQSRFLVEAQPTAVLPWCPILGPFPHGPSGYGPYGVWGLPSHGNDPTFSHQRNLLPLPSNFTAHGLPAMFNPMSEYPSRFDPTISAMMGLSWGASGRIPSLPPALAHQSGPFGPLSSSIGPPLAYQASPPLQPADFYMVPPPPGPGLLGPFPRQAVPSPLIHNRTLISQHITNSRDQVWRVTS